MGLDSTVRDCGNDVPRGDNVVGSEAKMILADMKRLKVGDVLTLTTSANPHKWLGVPRKIIKVQSNAIVLENGEKSGGSYLAFPKAKDFVSFGESSFGIVENGKVLLAYQIETRIV